MVIYYSTKTNGKLSIMMKTKTLTQHINISHSDNTVEYWDRIRGKTLGVISSTNQHELKFHLIYWTTVLIFQKWYGVTTIEIDRGAGQKKCGNCHRFGFGNGQSIDPGSG
jgi:hypothetical protein